MFKKTAIVAGIALAVSAAAQADYQWELGAAYATGDADIGENVNPDVDTFGGYGTYFIDAVDDTKGPKAEAAFLDRASSISIFSTRENIDGDAIDDKVTKDYGLAIRSVISDAGWIVDFGYSRNKSDTLQNSWSAAFPAGYQGTGLNTIDSDSFEVGVGKYLTDKTTLVFSYGYEDIDEGGDVDSYGVELEHLFTFGFGDIKADLNYRRIDPSDSLRAQDLSALVNKDDDDIDAYGIGATYYITQNIGLGARYDVTDLDGDKWNEWGISASWFITDQWEVALGYTDGEADDVDDLEQSEAVLSGRFRF